MIDAQVAWGLSGAASSGSLVDLAARVLIENGGVASAGVAAGALARGTGRAPVTSEGLANASTGARLHADLQVRAGVQPDTSRDAYYIAMTDPRLAIDNRFDWDHVLAGDVNRGGMATGYHAEFAAGGAARIRDGATIKQNPNGTYEAPVQIWDPARSDWINKRRDSTFFPAVWSQARVQYEVTEAFKAGQSAGLSGGSFRASSPSGVEIQFHWDATNLRTTFHPSGR